MDPKRTNQVEPLNHPNQYPSEDYNSHGYPPPNTTYSYNYPPSYAPNPYYPPVPYTAPVQPQQQQQQQQQSTVIVIGSQQQENIVVAPPFVSFTGPIVFSCFVFWFCGWLFGLIAFIIAIVGMMGNDHTTARQMYRASCGVSIAGLIVGIILIIIIISVVVSSSSQSYSSYYSSSSSSSSSSSCSSFSTSSCSGYGYYYNSLGCKTCCSYYSYSRTCYY